MKLTVDAKALAAAAKAAAGLVPSRVAIPATALVWLTADAEGLTLQATDLDRWLTRRVPAAVTEPGSIAVDAKLFATVAGGCAGPVTLTVRQRAGANTREIEVSAGRSRRRLAELPGEVYPAPRERDWPHRATLPGEVWARMIAAATPGCEAEAVGRPALEGALLGPADGGLRLVGTDGKVLLSTRVACAEASWPPAGAIVPVPALGVLRALAEASDVPVTLATDGTLLRAEAGAATFTTKLIDAVYPDVDRAMAPVLAGLSAGLAVDVASLGEALAQVAPVGEATAKLGGVVTLAAEPTVLRVTARSDNADGEAEVPADGEGAAFAASFTMRQLGRALPAFDGAAVLSLATKPDVLHIRPKLAGPIETFALVFAWNA